jgi:hypothetical protein
MIYAILRYLHVLGALGLAAAFAIEAAGLVGLRRAAAAEEARAWLRTRRWVMMVGPASIGLVLATGLGALPLGWGWMAWMGVALAGQIAIAVVGGVLTGIPMSRIGPAVERIEGPLPEALQREIQGRVLVISITTRIGITGGMLWLMIAKPGLSTSLGAVAAAAALGAAAGLAIGRRG